jgi:acetyltransferase-like isoleucine patch superfamily enzyme
MGLPFSHLPFSRKEIILEEPVFIEEVKVNRFFVSFRHFYKILLGMVAYYIPFPSVLIAFVQRLRGVKFRKLSGVFIGYHVLIDSVTPEYLEIEEEVALGRNVTIITHFNPTTTIKEFVGGRYARRVSIGRGSLILIGAMILPGVRVGKRSVVGAGSVVTKDVPDYTFVAGNPAKVIKTFKPLDCGEER